MKFTIDTTTKIIEATSISLDEIETIKKALVVMGLNPTEFNIVSAPQYYPQFYPQQQPYYYPNSYMTGITFTDSVPSN